MPAPRWRMWAFLLDSREGSQARMTPPPPPILPLPLAPPEAGGTPAHGPGRTTHDGTPPHGHNAPRESAREDGVQAVRATLPSNGATRGRPQHPVHSQVPPLLVGPPPRQAGRSSNAGGGAIQFGRPGAGGTSLRGSRPPGHSGVTDGDRPGTGTRGRAGGHGGCPTGPPEGTDGSIPGTDTRGDAGGYTGRPGPRDEPHGNGRALVMRTGEAPIPTQHPPITAPYHSLHSPISDVVLAQCRGANAARGPHRRGGAACSRWCPTSA